MASPSAPSRSRSPIPAPNARLYSAVSRVFGQAGERFTVHLRPWSRHIASHPLLPGLVVMAWL